MWSGKTLETMSMLLSQTINLKILNASWGVIRFYIFVAKYTSTWNEAVIRFYLIDRRTAGGGLDFGWAAWENLTQWGEMFEVVVRLHNVLESHILPSVCEMIYNDLKEKMWT